MPEVNSNSECWDVIVIGGALSGASTACLLLREMPELKILILEKSADFKRRVGESTVEVSAYFLGRVMDLTGHLLEKHLVKQGLRFWFKNEQTSSLDTCSEIGPGYNVRLPGYQVDRAVLDEEILARAIASGASLNRPVTVKHVELKEGGLQTVTWHDKDGGHAVASARWVVDSSGVAAMLARKNGWFSANTEHPIAAVWSRWSGVKNWDSLELAEKFPAWAKRTKAVRQTATNHLLGRGWWAWMIPLKGGDVSIGVVFDQRLVDLPEAHGADGRLGSRLKSMLLEHPAARDLLTDASWHEGDVHFRRNLAYKTSTFAGHGFVLVGDSAGFIDPFYSPGMDWISYCANSSCALLTKAMSGEPMDAHICEYNQLFSTSYDRWFEAIYKDKYLYMGDYELMSLAFRLDLGLYYMGVVSQPFKHGRKALQTPSFSGPGTKIPSRLIAFYNRRLASIALSRMQRETWGRKNSGHFLGFRSYELTMTLPVRILWAFASYLRLELSEGWRTWFKTPKLSAEKPKDANRARPSLFRRVSAPAPL